MDQYQYSNVIALYLKEGFLVNLGGIRFKLEHVVVHDDYVHMSGSPRFRHNGEEKMFWCVHKHTIVSVFIEAFQFVSIPP